MPTSDEMTSVMWQKWLPDNLLDDPAEMAVPVLDNEQSQATIKAELARLRQQAEQQGNAQGHKRGLEEGRAQGYEEGLLQGREAGRIDGMEQARRELQVQLQNAASWLQDFRLGLDNLDSLIPGRLVQLALTAVQQLQGTHTGLDNHALVTKIRHLMKQDALLQGSVGLHVNPDEYTLIEDALGETLGAAGWTLHRDPQLAAGGCRVVAAEVEFDASTETRWQTLCQIVRKELAQ